MCPVMLMPITLSSVPLQKMELITITLLFSFHTYLLLCCENSNCSAIEKERKFKGSEAIYKRFKVIIDCKGYKVKRQ